MFQSDIRELKNEIVIRFLKRQSIFKVRLRNARVIYLSSQDHTRDEVCIYDYAPVYRSTRTAQTMVE